MSGQSWIFVAFITYITFITFITIDLACIFMHHARVFMQTRI
jgi:hypothetical protein